MPRWQHGFQFLLSFFFLFWDRRSTKPTPMHGILFSTPTMGGMVGIHVCQACCQSIVIGSHKPKLRYVNQTLMRSFKNKNSKLYILMFLPSLVIGVTKLYMWLWRMGTPDYCSKTLTFTKKKKKLGTSVELLSPLISFKIRLWHGEYFDLLYTWGSRSFLSHSKRKSCGHEREWGLGNICKLKSLKVSPKFIVLFWTRAQIVLYTLDMRERIF